MDPNPKTTPASPGSGPTDPKPASTPPATPDLVARHGGDTAREWGSLPPKPGSAPRGRPRKDGRPPGSGPVPPPPRPALASSGPRVAPLPGVAPSPAPSPGYAAAPIDPVLLERTVESLLGALDKVTVSVVSGKARKVMDDDRAVAEVAEAVKMSPANRELISKNLPVVMSKHGISSEHLPEFALLAGLGGWASGFLVAVNKLEKMAADAEAKRKEVPA